MADSIGALWEKKDKNGNTYFSGQIELVRDGEKIPVVIFHNDKEGNEKKPDWKIFRSQPRQ